MDQAIEILLVEDNPDHATLTRRVLENGNILNKVHWVKDGQEALDFMFHEGAYKDAPCPGLILLDIKLPKVNGLEVLKKVKETEAYHKVPVIMLTTSDRGKRFNRVTITGPTALSSNPSISRNLPKRLNR